MGMSDREKVINDLQSQIEELEERLAIVLEWQPEIVRCKYCWKNGNPYLCILDRDLEEYGSYRTEADDDWFCADGERRTDDA